MRFDFNPAYRNNSLCKYLVYNPLNSPTHCAMHLLPMCSAEYRKYLPSTSRNLLHFESARAV